MPGRSTPARRPATREAVRHTIVLFLRSWRRLAAPCLAGCGGDQGERLAVQGALLPQLARAVPELLELRGKVAKACNRGHRSGEGWSEATSSRQHTHVWVSRK